MKVQLLALIAFTTTITQVVAAAPRPPSQYSDLITEASLLTWLLPEYPADAKAAKLKGQVTVQFVLDAEGKLTEAKVVQASDPRFAEPALACVRRWTFAPAEEGGRQVACAMAVTVLFDPAFSAERHSSPFGMNPPRPLATKPPKEKLAPAPAFPTELEGRVSAGSVLVAFEVNEQGRTEHPRVLHATHAALVAPALACLAQSEFEPARQGPVAKRSSMRQGIEFSPLSRERLDPLATFNLTAAGGAPLTSLDATPPLLETMVDPVFPRELLLADETGEAAVEFTVTFQGRVQAVVVVSATRPEFGEALRAAVETWGFQPAMNGGKGVEVRLRVTQRFAQPEAGAPAAELVAALRRDGGIPSPKDLDQKLTPIWQVAPLFPAALKSSGTGGAAEIDVVIDREGRVRFPRIARATQPEFGWAAVTAIARWVFQPPMRGGQPIAVRVRVPFDFKPTNE
jgi:TonB family protein